jgi:hypothetical protein
MTIHDLLAWAGPGLDVAVLLGLAATWWQLRRDPTVAWRAYEERLRELQESLRLLVMQAEGEARDLDRRLAAHAEQLGELTSEHETSRPAAASGRETARPAAASERETPRPAASSERETRAARPSERAAKTERPPREQPRPAEDEPRITPLAAAMAAAATIGTPPPLPVAPIQPPSLAERVQQLASAQTPIAEIARKLSLPIAEARVLAGLTTGSLGLGAGAGAATPGTTSRAGNGRIAS